MREILFRGKRLDNGEWVEGGVYHQNADDVKVDATWIIGGSLGYVGSAYPVDPETVSQYIGRKNDKGRRIFEGDILVADDVVYGEGGCFLIQWNEDWNGWGARRVGTTDDMFSIEELGDMEIVGNRWDTPNLLGGETEEGPDR